MKIEVKKVLLLSVLLAVGGITTHKVYQYHYQHQQAVTVQTIYGQVAVKEPVIKELLACDAMQRLKKINQYGVMKLVKPQQDYTRYEHSLGVFYILHRFGAPLEEQVAGLLHDVSHTAFSHVIDFVHGTLLEKYSYQDKIFAWYLQESGVMAILKKYNLERVAQFGNGVEYTMLKDNLPHLCADRIEYNIYGGYLEGWITKEQAKDMVNHIVYQDGEWIFTDKKVAELFAKISIDLSTQNWCSVENGFLSQQLANLIKRGLELSVITNDDLHFSVDETVWEKLVSYQDEQMQRFVNLINNHQTAYQEGTKEQHDQYFKGKFRGLDPLVLTENGTQRLSSIDTDFVQYCDAARNSVHEHYIQYLA